MRERETFMDRYNYAGSPEFRPLSPWAYFGYALLFSIPLVGLIVLIVLSFNSENINRRNFARSYWCVYVVGAITLLVLGGSSLAFLSAYL